MKTPSFISASTLVLSVSLSLGLSGCVSNPQKPQGQELLQQALAREATLSNTYKVAAEDGFFSAQIAGSAQPSITLHEWAYQVTIPIGTDTPAECFVYLEAMDSAATLSRLIDEPLNEMPRTQTLKIDAGTFGTVPFLYQERLYLTEAKAAGVLKGAVLPFDSSLVACFHDTAGYSETFRRMVDSLAQSLVLRDEPGDAFVHEEVLVWRLRDMNVGFTLNRAAYDADGDIESTVETAVLLPRSASEVLAHDEYDITYETPEGELISGNYAEAENGQIKLSIRLDQVEGGGYQVSGSFQGKEIDAPLQAGAQVFGPYYQHRAMVEAANPADGQPRAVSFDAYVPSANPLQIITFDVSPTGARVDGSPEYKLVFAGVNATGVVDERGQRSLAVSMGPLDLQLSRAYVNSRN